MQIVSRQQCDTIKKALDMGSIWFEDHSIVSGQSCRLTPILETMLYIK